MAESSNAHLRLAAMFKAAGDPMRLDILRIMRHDSYGVLELCKIFSVQQPSMSHHLKVLSKAGLVATRREGNSIFYRRGSAAEKTDSELLAVFFGLLDTHSVNPALITEVDHVQQARRVQATEFFRVNAHRFREQQDLIAGHDDYGALVAGMLAKNKESTWMEVGPGSGDLLNECAANFAAVQVIDISQELLEQSRKTLPADLQIKTEFRLSDTAGALKDGIQADVISCNMVLHHVPSPAEVVSDMAAMLRDQGQLLITDLDLHDQDWAREACGDLWLGFAPEQLNEWALSSGLKEKRSEFLALRNGFSVQIREYIRA